jgi:hypothetical protein
MDSPYTPPNSPLEEKQLRGGLAQSQRFIRLLFGVAGIAGAAISFQTLLRLAALRRELDVAVSLMEWAIPGLLAGAAGLTTIACSLSGRRSRWLRNLSIASLLLALVGILVTPIAGYSVRNARKPPPSQRN